VRQGTCGVTNQRPIGVGLGAAVQRTPLLRSAAMVRSGGKARLLLCGVGCLGVGLWLGRQTASTALALAEAAAAPTAASALPSFANVVAAVLPGIVNVHVELGADAKPVDATLAAPNPTHAAGERRGSGFLVSERGLVVTSRHVVLGARAMQVSVPARGDFAADLVGEDAATDLALLRLVAAPVDLPALAIGDSLGLRPGDWIVAIGNPLGYSQTVTPGVVSYVGRHLPHRDYELTNDFLQISAPVNPGSSGCPVFDLAGRVVGVTTQAPVDAQGISFAVPSQTLKWSLQAMQRQTDGRVRRGYLGIEFTSGDVAVDAPESFGKRRAGAFIRRVLEGQPAHRAGLCPGDLVVGFDGRPVLHANDLHQRIVESEPGRAVALALVRQGRELPTVTAVLGEVGPVRPATAN
jgi:serine protease Do